jgi:two-component system chemotaxis response regulator CheY
MMPEMDGQAALKAIRQLEKEKGVLPKDEVPVIMTTALDTPKEVVEAFYRGGCTEYMVKPIEKRKIIDFLREHGLMT